MAAATHMQPEPVRLVSCLHCSLPLQPKLAGLKTSLEERSLPPRTGVVPANKSGKLKHNPTTRPSACSSNAQPILPLLTASMPCHQLRHPTDPQHRTLPMGHQRCNLVSAGPEQLGRHPPPRANLAPTRRV
eukprot:136144-Amphidinium_carterae.1